MKTLAFALSMMIVAACVDPNDPADPTVDTVELARDGLGGCGGSCSTWSGAGELIIVSGQLGCTTNGGATYSVCGSVGTHCTVRC